MRRRKRRSEWCATKNKRARPPQQSVRAWLRLHSRDARRVLRRRGAHCGVARRIERAGTKHSLQRHFLGSHRPTHGRCRLAKQRMRGSQVRSVFERPHHPSLFWMRSDGNTRYRRMGVAHRGRSDCLVFSHTSCWFVPACRRGTIHSEHDLITRRAYVTGRRRRGYFLVTRYLILFFRSQLASR